jgi:hypothetical protein
MARNKKGYRYPKGKLNSLAGMMLAGSLGGMSGGNPLEAENPGGMGDVGLLDADMEAGQLSPDDPRIYESAVIQDEVSRGPVNTAIFDEVTTGPVVQTQMPSLNPATTQLPRPEFKVKGFGNHMMNFLTKGSLSRGAADANNQAALAEYQGGLRAGMMDRNNVAAMERLRQANALKQAMLPQETEELRIRARNAAAYENKVTPEIYEQSVVPTTTAELGRTRAGLRPLEKLYDTPEFNKAEQDRYYADAGKQRYINEESAAAAKLKHAQAEREGWVPVTEGAGVVNIGDGREIYNQPALEFKPEIPGGIRRSGPVKRPGGLFGDSISTVPPNGGAKQAIQPNARFVQPPPPIAQAPAIDPYSEYVRSFAPKVARPYPVAPVAGGTQQTVTQPTTIEQALDTLIHGLGNPNLRKLFPGRY